MYIKIIAYVESCINNKQEFTISVKNNGDLYKPSSGFAVSITPLINIRINTIEIIKYIVYQKSININGKNHKLYLGGWFENNEHKLKTDISIITQSLEEAIKIGKHCNQDAIYDIFTKKTIYLK